MNDSNNLSQFLYDKYLEYAQPTTSQTPTPYVPSIPMSQLYDILVRGPRIFATSSPEGWYVELDEYLYCSSYAQQEESFDILLW